MISCVAFRLRRKQYTHFVALSMFLWQVKVKGSWKLQIHAAPVCYDGFVLKVRLDLTSNWKTPAKTAFRDTACIWTPGTCGRLKMKIMCPCDGIVTVHTQYVFGWWKSHKYHLFSLRLPFLSPLLCYCGTCNSLSHLPQPSWMDVDMAN